MLRLGGHFVSAGHFANSQSAPGLIVVCREFFESSSYLDGGLLERGRNLVRGERLIGYVNHALDYGFEVGIGKVSGNQVFAPRGQFPTTALASTGHLSSRRVHVPQ